MSNIKNIVLGTAFLILAVGGHSSVAQERLAVTTSIGNDVIVKGYAWVNGNCEMTQSPPIFVDRPPRHGTLCSIIAPARLDPPVVGGTRRCVGRQVDTIQIVYLPKTDYVGPDDTHYIVKFPAADFGVEIALTIVLGGPPQQASPVAPDVSEALHNKIQLPGLLLPCAALVS